MNRQFAKPIRTYERKKCKNVAVVYQNLQSQSSNDVGSKNRVSLRKKLNEVESKEVDDNSMYYDPFDTTFDRLARNARIPPPVPKTCSNENSYISSDNNSTWNINQSEHKPIDLDDVIDKKPISKQRVIDKKAKMQTVKKTIKRKPLESRNKKSYKVNKNETRKKYKSYKTRNNNQSGSTDLNIDSLNLHSEADSEIKNDHKTERNNYNKKYSVEKNKKNINKLNEQFTKNVQMKSCSVVLDTANIVKLSSKVNSAENDLSAAMNENTSKEQQLSEPDSTKAKTENLECCNVDAKYCFVKVKRLDVDSNTKLFNLGEKYGNVFSSTPKNRVVKSHLISLSPIPIGHSKSLNNSMMHTNNISTSVNNKDLVPNDIDNNICIKEKQLAEETYERSLKLVQDNSTNEIKQNYILQECVVVDAEKRKYEFNFSVDINRSHSLFDDADENLGSRLHSDILLDNKMSTSNIMLDKINTTSHNEIIPDITYDKIKEKSAGLISPKSVILDTSCDDVQFKLKTMETVDESNKENTLEQIESSFKKNDTSFPSNNKEYNMHDSYVILKRLQDPIRITKRRKRSCKWNFDITSIPEDCNNSIEQINLERKEEPKRLMLPRKKLIPLENIIEESVNKESVDTNKPIYLKPGKSWARSLSILNNIQNISKLDKLSIGKGKKWRHSVQDVLNMQKQGIIQSCIKENSSEKELQVCNEEINESECKLTGNKSRTSDSTNFGHLSRRISVRVVPIHPTVKSIEDAPFLEVYGIVPVKSQRYTLINRSKKSSVCNIQNDDFNSQDIKEDVTTTAKEVILQRCSQEDYIPFSAYFTDSYLEHCRKIGEGVYGEVFLYEHEDKKSVVKVIPIEGNEHVNGEPQKKFHEILSEIVIAMELHNLRSNTAYNTDGFVEVKNIKCIKGKYPEKLVTLWNVYDEEKHSDNDCPSVFNDDQLYIVLELGHGGQDLEAFVFNTADEAHTLFIQAALALAVAEKAVEFEHRDLHWGNILISSTSDSHVHYKLGRRKIKLLSKGVKVSIIDFTLSRVTYQGCSVFNDLALDPTLFTAQGEYQFEIYRLMRDKVKNDWQIFEPYTNILWLHYTLDKMITAVRYRKRKLKMHKNGIKKLQELKNEILTYSSAFDFVTNSDKIVNLVYNNS